jgi:TetR/AcrR family transcriptional repressor of nem operon
VSRPNDTRTKLIAGAVRLLHQRSYGQTSVEALCEAAGVQKGSFYHYFPSKLDLVLTALDEQWQSARAFLMEPAFARDLPPTQRITRFFQLAYEANKDGQAALGCMLGCPFGNLVAELGPSEPAIRLKVREVFDGYAGYFAGALDEAISDGSLPPHDVAIASEALLAYFQGMMLVAVARDDADVLARLFHFPLALLANDFAGKKAS